MTALIRAGTFVSEAHASWGIWAARCGACRPGAERLQRFQAEMLCSFCGMVTDIIWPSAEMVKGVERLLTMRPDPSTRSWKPGETLSELSWENGEHGIYDGLAEAVGATPGTAMLSVTDNRIQVDELPRRLPNQAKRSLEG